MYTSIVLVALAGSVATSSPQEGMSWSNNYAQARKVAQEEKKPMAIFFGSGRAGYAKVCKDGQLSNALQKKLAENYVCLYVDVSTPAGQKLAEDFAVTKGQGLVLSDRTGDVQAFYHDGDLSDADLSRWLTQYADPNVVVTTTKTNTASQVSFYPSTNNGTMGASGSGMYGPAGYTYGYVPYQPYQYGSSPMWYGGGGGGCPGGRCGR